MSEINRVTPADIDHFDPRADAKRYAALKALSYGIDSEVKEIAQRLIEVHRLTGAASFASELGKINVTATKPKFTISDREAFVEQVIADGAGMFVREETIIPEDKMAEAIEVLRKHAPHLVETVRTVDESYEEAFLKGLDVATFTTKTPVLDEDGDQVVEEDVNLLTGEIVEVPVFDERTIERPVRKVSRDGEKVDEVVEFVSYVPGGEPRLSYPATKEQKATKAQAAAFFEQGDLTITREIVRPKEIER